MSASPCYPVTLYFTCDPDKKNVSSKPIKIKAAIMKNNDRIYTSLYRWIWCACSHCNIQSYMNRHMTYPSWMVWYWFESAYLIHWFLRSRKGKGKLKFLSKNWLKLSVFNTKKNNKHDSASAAHIFITCKLCYTWHIPIFRHLPDSCQFCYISVYTVFGKLMRFVI